MREVVPSDPSRDEYRQGNTLGAAYRHWRRAKIGRRFRLFFRYDSKANVIVFAWVNDEQTLRSAGSKSDPYAVFEKMLGRGNPPDDWNALKAASRENGGKLEYPYRQTAGDSRENDYPYQQRKKRQWLTTKGRKRS